MDAPEGRLLPRRRFVTLREVIDHYDELFDLGLSEGDKADLEQFLLSLGDPLDKRK